jgi:potassium uptake TrkH family protein
MQKGQTSNGPDHVSNAGVFYDMASQAGRLIPHEPISDGLIKKMTEHDHSPQRHTKAGWQRVAVLLAWPLQTAQEKLYPRLDVPLRVLVDLLALAGVLSLVFAYGFDRQATLAQVAIQSQRPLCWTIVAAMLLRAIIHPRGWHLAKQQWLRIILISLFILSHLLLYLALIPPGRLVFFIELNVSALAALLPFVDQSFLVAIVLIEGADYSRNITARTLRPEQTLALSFLLLIFLGSLLLMLPNATVQPGSMPFLAALFTATSAVCVTGLAVVDTATYFTPFGQGIILLLCQLGALGILTFATVIGMMVRGDLGLRERMVLRDFTSSLQIGEIAATIRLIVGMTLLIEALGVLLLYWSWPASTQGSRLWIAVFHAVSAFCNAGFSTLSDSLAAPDVASHIGVNLIVMTLIVLGGLGFLVIWETWRWLRGRLRKQPMRLSVQSRLVWAATGILIGAGAVGFALLESQATLESCSGHTCWLGPLFQSVTARTAGFNTLPVDAFAVPTVVFFMLLMVIGVSPGSTGGGMKTTTVAVLLLSTLAAIRGQPHVEAFRRTIPEHTVQRAYATFFFFFTAITIGVFVLTITETQPFLELVFEEISAFATVGLSRGITSSLSKPGQVVIIISMFIGRVGSLTLAVALTRPVATTAYEYPTETVMVG